MAYPMDSVPDYYTPSKGQLAALPELQNCQLHQSFEQSHAGSCVKSTFNISRICTMSSLISKKAFDRVWHAALWATMRKYIISANLVRTIEQLYDKNISAVQMTGSIGEWFKITVGVRQE